MCLPITVDKLCVKYCAYVYVILNQQVASELDTISIIACHGRV